jgi:hypothetical protein
MGGTWLQGHIKSGTGSRFTPGLGTSKCLNLGVCMSGLTMPSFTQNLSILDQNRSNYRIRRSFSHAFGGQPQGSTHEPEILCLDRSHITTTSWDPIRMQ